MAETTTDRSSGVRVFTPAAEWVPPRGRLRWRLEDEEAMVAALRASGETLAGFARRHGVQEVRVQRWVARVGRKPRPPVGADWQWVAWHIAEAVPASEQQQALKNGKVPPELPRSITGAEEVVTLFEATIADPKALAKTVSPDPHVRLYGSELAESVAGGAAVRKRLERWGLVLKVRDGIQAGMAAGNHVAYVAANVDAVPQKRPKARPEPYRLLFVYARTAQGWQLVQAHFSVVR